MPKYLNDSGLSYFKNKLLQEFENPVAESGYEDGWNYIVFSSGIAMCFATKPFNFGTGTQWNSSGIYHHNQIDWITLPSIFGAKPQIYASSNNGIIWWAVGVLPESSEYQFKLVYATGARGGSTTTLDGDFFCIGISGA